MTTLGENDEENAEGRTPFVMLNIDEISHHMAARLTCTLLEQSLYMKGQVPFPVASLERMSGHRYSGDLPPRDRKLVKKRKEVLLSYPAPKSRLNRDLVYFQFIDAYDDLRSHLETTFVALSTAYAHNPTFLFTKTNLAVSEVEVDSHVPNYRSARVHLFLVTGSSLTLPKTRILLELNNFHVEKFGERDFMTRQLSKASLSSDEGSEDKNEVSGDQAESDDEEAETASNTEELDSSYFFSVPSTPRRTASFYTPSASPAPEPPDTPSSSTSESSRESEQSSPETSLSEDHISGTRDCHLHHGSNSVEDESFRDCEKVFSKALLRFGEALGFGNELAPTQTHILLHAPRRFSHPTWVPRQNMTQSLNKVMAPLVASGSDATKTNNNKGKKLSGTLGSHIPTVGLRVVCQLALLNEENDDKDVDADDKEDDGVDELDELIWWSWDGKLVGFSD